MKTTLILTLLMCGYAWAADKKADLRQGKKAVNVKYLESITKDETATKALSDDVQASQNKAQQLEAKKSRQFQEERPVE